MTSTLSVSSFFSSEDDRRALTSAFKSSTAPIGSDDRIWDVSLIVSVNVSFAFSSTGAGDSCLTGAGDSCLTGAGDDSLVTFSSFVGAGLTSLAGVVSFLSTSSITPSASTFPPTSGTTSSQSSTSVKNVDALWLVDSSGAGSVL